MKSLSSVCLLLLLALVRWACLARITHDEGYMLGVIDNFTSEHVMRHVYNGSWGTTWIVTIGPTVSLPLGILAHLIGVSVIAARLYVLALVGSGFYVAGRLVGLKREATLVAGAVFLLWVACMPWAPAINGSSFNLIANVFGEGVAFVFALLANLMAIKRDRRSRSYAWLCILLAVGAKTVAVIAIVIPAAYLLIDAVRCRDVRRAGWPGLLAALAVFLAWQGWQVGVMGWGPYLDEWAGLFSWLRNGGGYVPGLELTHSSKWSSLAFSYVKPELLIGLTILSLIFIIRFMRILPRGTFSLLAPSTALFWAWWIFLSSRGWMRHLWIGYAFVGWAVAVIAGRLLFEKKEKWHEAAVLVLVLVVLSSGFGSLRALGPLDEQSRWATQKRVAEELGERFPRAQFFVPDWRFVPQIPFFLKKPQNNVFEVPMRPGDIVLCDLESSDCGEKIFGKICWPMTMTPAFSGYCVFQGKR